MDLVGVITMVIIVLVVGFAWALLVGTSRLEKEIQEEINGDKGEHEVRGV